MLSIDTIMGGAAVAAAWFAKEVGGIVLREYITCRGQLNYLPNGRYFLRKFSNEDGTETLGATWPFPKVKGEKYIGVEFLGAFVNATAREIILKNVDLTFFGIEGARITHSNPSVTIGDGFGQVHTIPPNSHAHARIALNVQTDELDSLYKETVPVLNVETISGKKYHYKLHYAFLGETGIKWDKKKHRVLKI